MLSTVPLLVVLGGCAGLSEHNGDRSNTELTAGQAYASGQWQAARKGYRDALSRDPDNAELLLRLANIDQHEHKWGEAQLNYLRVIQLAPRDRRAHYNLAVLHLRRAEQYFQYYVALTEAGAESPRLLALLAAIGTFADTDSGPLSPLEQLGRRLTSERPGAEQGRSGLWNGSRQNND